MQHICDESKRELVTSEEIYYDEEHKEWILTVEGTHWDHWSDQLETVEMTINYCPFCGERLEVK